MKYGKWLDNWYTAYVKPTLKSKTCERYSEVIEGHLKAALGEYALKDVTSTVVCDYVTRLLRCGNLKTGEALSSSTVNGIIFVIRGSLKAACDAGIIKRCYLGGIARRKSEGRTVTCFSEREQRVLEQTVLSGKKRNHIGILICLYTGLRIGELLAPTWADVDFENGVISVNKTCHYGKDENGVFGRITERHKTLSSKRAIPLPKKLSLESFCFI